MSADLADDSFIATSWVHCMTARVDSPGVQMPPPALYALAVLVGYLLNRRWPFPVGDSGVVRGFAWVLTLACIALSVSSIGRFWRSRTSIVPIRPATILVIAGPYRFTRNPMYVGLAALTIALGLFINSWWPTVLLLPVLQVVRWFVIAPEERYLERRFGADYLAYRQRFAAGSSLSSRAGRCGGHSRLGSRAKMAARRHGGDRRMQPPGTRS
jgi:protein-S-isoprenylcysteine O-methyltransferase Ste14